MFGFISANKKNIKCLSITIIILIIILIVLAVFLCLCKNKNESIFIKEPLVKQKYNELLAILGKPTYLETNGNIMNSVTWMSPLDSFNDFGKFGGCDLVKLSGHISKKYHPHPANLFVIVGKYIHVPEHLFGPLKYASETINIEQLFVPINYAQKYYETGVKEIALVTGSCASITISAITVQFVIDMINKYKDIKKSLELYDIFREEYDRRINNYLCGKGITENIPWFDNKYFEEGDTAFLGNKKCNIEHNVIENYSHYEGCKDLMKNDNYCKNNPENKCC